MSGKKVVYINTVAGKGSVGRLVTGLAGELKKRGSESLIAFGRWDAPEGFNTYRINRGYDVYLHGILSRITDRHGLYSAAATERLIRKLREYDPDLIHLHNIHGYYVNYERLFSFLKNEYAPAPGHRIIWTLHDCWSFTGHCVHFEYAGCDRWKGSCHDCPEKKQYPASYFADNSRKNYEIKRRCFTGLHNLTIVTPSRWLESRVKESFLRDYRVETVPTGIDLSSFRPVRSELRRSYGIGDKLLILGAANPWRERKGLGDFIRLAEKLGSRAVIVMIGLKPAQIRKIPGNGNIIPLGKTDSISDMAAWYSAANFYVNLTYEDTFPTTNLEALACGTPVISYDAGGSGESISEGTGRVVPTGDIDGVIRAAEELLSRDREDMKAACIESASAYGSEIRFRQYIEDIYRF